MLKIAVALLAAALLTAGAVGCTNFETKSELRPIGPPLMREDPDLADDSGDFRGEYWSDSWRYDRNARRWIRQ